jgi:hypothetical protein
VGELLLGNEEVRVAILVALSAWIAKAGEVLPSEASTFFAAGLKEKETLRRAQLRCLRLSFRNGEMPVKVTASMSNLDISVLCLDDKRAVLTFS